MVQPRHILNGQETVKQIQRDLAVARRKMTQIISDQVTNKLTTEQINSLTDTMRIGTALNTNPNRENANGAIFLTNMLKEIVGKDLLTFTPSPNNKGLPQFN